MALCTGAGTWCVLAVDVLIVCVCVRVCAAEIGPASVMVGNLVSGKRIAQASGRDLGQIEDNDQARKVCVRRGLLVFTIDITIITHSYV